MPQVRHIRRTRKQGFHDLERITLKMDIIKTPFRRQRQAFPSSQCFWLKGREHKTKPFGTSSHKRTQFIPENNTYATPIYYLHIMRHRHWSSDNPWEVWSTSPLAKPISVAYMTISNQYQLNSHVLLINLKRCNCLYIYSTLAKKNLFRKYVFNTISFFLVFSSLHHIHTISL